MPCVYLYSYKIFNVCNEINIKINELQYENYNHFHEKRNNKTAN